MKSLRSQITICVLFTAAAITLSAQTTPSQKLMTVKIPFAFSAQDYSLPEGEYFVLTVTPERSIRIVSTDGKHSAIVNTLPNYANEPSTRSRLVFHRYGNEYFLAQVWTTGQNVGRNPLSGKRAMEIADSGQRPQTFTVSALADRR
jgi:hypothetical protein